MDKFFRNKKVLITGVTGFKGAWLAQILHLWGARVVGVSLRPHTKPNLFSIFKLDKNIKNYFADIRDFKKIKNIFSREKPEIVIHLAAQALVRKSYDEPLATYSTNILGTANILECVKATRSVKSSVIITTDKVYANSGSPSTGSGANILDKFYSEEDSLGASDPYSSSKAAADIVAQAYIKQGVRAAIARAGNVIGGGDWGADRLVVDLARSIYEKGEACAIRNPGHIRPWQHVFEPLAGYLVLAKEVYNGNEKALNAWNFGPRQESHAEVKTIAADFIAFSGMGTYKISPDDSKSESAILKLDAGKAEKILGWAPRLSLNGAVRLTSDWYREFYKNSKNIVEFSNGQIEKYFK